MMAWCGHGGLTVQAASKYKDEWKSGVGASMLKRRS
jgi:hypothetical protein